MLQTHSYDGNWKDEMNKIFVKDGDIEFDIDEVRTEIEEIQPELKPQLLMIKDYDLKNEVDACEILARVWRKAKKEEEYDLLFEQILDVGNGSCAQGQTTRLFQVLSSFYPDQKEK